MAVGGSLQISNDLGICKSHVCNKLFLCVTRSGKLHLLKLSLSSLALRLDPWSIRLSGKEYRPKCPIPYKRNVFKCHSFLNPSKGSEISCMKNADIAFTRSCNAFQGSPIVLKLVSAVGIIVFAVWGLGPLMRQCRNMLLHSVGSYDTTFRN